MAHKPAEKLMALKPAEKKKIIKLFKDSVQTYGEGISLLHIRSKAFNKYTNAACSLLNVTDAVSMENVLSDWFEIWCNLKDEYIFYVFGRPQRQFHHSVKSFGKFYDHPRFVSTNCKAFNGQKKDEKLSSASDWGIVSMIAEYKQINLADYDNQPDYYGTQSEEILEYLVGSLNRILESIDDGKRMRVLGEVNKDIDGNMDSFEINYELLMNVSSTAATKRLIDTETCALRMNDMICFTLKADEKGEMREFPFVEEAEETAARRGTSSNKTGTAPTRKYNVSAGGRLKKVAVITPGTPVGEEGDLFEKATPGGGETQLPYSYMTVDSPANESEEDEHTNRLTSCTMGSGALQVCVIYYHCFIHSILQ